MPGILAALTLVVMLGMVLTRVLVLRASGTRAMHFGSIDKTDFLIPPFAVFYFYTVFAAAFHLPTLTHRTLFRSDLGAWIGIALCAAGLTLLLQSLVAFGKSFRVGIDTERPDVLVTSGVFAFSRNPIYVAFGSILLGQFLVFPNPILLLYLIAAVALFHRQVLREERFMAQHYGDAFADYCRRVRRYL